MEKMTSPFEMLEPLSKFITSIVLDLKNMKKNIGENPFFVLALKPVDW